MRNLYSEKKVFMGAPILLILFRQDGISGINVAGKNKVATSDFKGLLSGVDFEPEEMYYSCFMMKWCMWVECDIWGNKDFYKQVTIRNGNTFEKIAESPGNER